MDEKKSFFKHKPSTCTSFPACITINSAVCSGWALSQLIIKVALDKSDCGRNKYSIATVQARIWTVRREKSVRADHPFKMQFKMHIPQYSSSPNQHKLKQNKTKAKPMVKPLV